MVSSHELAALVTPLLSYVFLKFLYRLVFFEFRRHPNLIKQFNEILGIGQSTIRLPNKLEKLENRVSSELASHIGTI